MSTISNLAPPTLNLFNISSYSSFLLLFLFIFILFIKTNPEKPNNKSKIISESIHIRFKFQNYSKEQVKDSNLIKEFNFFYEDSNLVKDSIHIVFDSNLLPDFRFLCSYSLHHSLCFSPSSHSFKSHPNSTLISSLTRHSIFFLTTQHRRFSSWLRCYHLNPHTQIPP